MPKSNEDKRKTARQNAIEDMKSSIEYMSVALTQVGRNADKIGVEAMLILDRSIGRYMKAVNRYKEAAKIRIMGGPESDITQ